MPACRANAEGTACEIYSRADGNGSVLILEAENEAEAKAIADALPVIKAGLTHYEIYGLKAYRAFVA